MKSLTEINKMLEGMTAKKWAQFRTKCEELNLTGASMATLIGTTRQTIHNYNAGTTAPCVATAIRITMVNAALDKAVAEGTLPAAHRRKQEALVEKILE